MEKRMLKNKTVFIFLSIDLTNSTLYKKKDSEWLKVFLEFFYIVKTGFMDKNTEINIWKYVGDEVLFYEEITSMDEILKKPSQVQAIVKSCEERMYSKNPKCREFLSLKTTIWLGAVKEAYDFETKDINNVILELSEGNIDFIGIDIDKGFRISKFSLKDNIAIDATFAYILYKNKERIKELYGYDIRDRIRIGDYKKLKGIWDDKTYPIIYYSNDNLDLVELDENELKDILELECRVIENVLG